VVTVDNLVDVTDETISAGARTTCATCMYLAAFDDRAPQVYRTAVTRLDADQAGRDRFSRFEIDETLLELADHDGDVGEACAAVDALVAETRERHRRRTRLIDQLDRAGLPYPVINSVGPSNIDTRTLLTTGAAGAQRASCATAARNSHGARAATGTSCRRTAGRPAAASSADVISR
jgi:hypothetical protein